MWRYLLIELAVLAALIGFVALMCQVVAKRLIWPGEPLSHSFVGSLLSAAGTIFAASIAWVIADQNLDYQQRAAQAEDSRRIAEGKVKQQRETLALGQAADLLDSIVRAVRDAPGHSARFQSVVIPEVQQIAGTTPTPALEMSVIKVRSQILDLQRRAKEAASQTSSTQKVTLEQIDGELLRILMNTEALQVRIRQEIQLRELVESIYRQERFRGQVPPSHRAGEVCAV